MTKGSGSLGTGRRMSLSHAKEETQWVAPERRPSDDEGQPVPKMRDVHGATRGRWVGSHVRWSVRGGLGCGWASSGTAGAPLLEAGLPLSRKLLRKVAAQCVTAPRGQLWKRHARTPCDGTESRVQAVEVAVTPLHEQRPVAARTHRLEHELEVHAASGRVGSGGLTHIGSPAVAENLNAHQRLTIPPLVGGGASA